MKTTILWTIIGFCFTSPAQAHLTDWIRLIQLRAGAGVTASALRESEPALARLIQQTERAAQSDDAFRLLNRSARHAAFTGRLLPLEAAAQTLRASTSLPEQRAAQWLLVALRQPPPAPNLYEALEAQGRLTRTELQRIALEQARNRTAGETLLRGQINEKLAFFDQVASERARLFEAPAALLDPTALGRDTLAYLLQTFHDVRWDTRFLEAVLFEIRNSGEINPRQLELLVAIARGAHFPDIAHSRVANEILLNAAGIPSSGFPQRFASDAPRTALEALIHEPIARVTARRQTSANGSFVVEFANGKRAMFKPYASEMAYQARNSNPWEIQFAREVGAYELVENWLGNAAARRAHLSGVFVPPTVETVLVHEGRSYGIGSLQEFQERFRTAKETMEQFPDTWAALMADPTFLRNLDRMRTIDWLLGNYDRWPNSVHTQGNFANMMISFPSGDLTRAQIALIDNGIGQGRMHQFWLRDMPSAASVPADLQQTLRAMDLDSFRRLNQGRLSQIAIEDFCIRVETLRQTF